MSAFPMNEPSLCIPRVFPNLTWKYIKDVIEGQGWGEVERVDVVKKENDKGEKFNRVFIHFKKWNEDEETMKVRNELIGETKGVKLVYDEPWFWIIRKSNVPRPTKTVVVKKDSTDEEEPIKSKVTVAKPTKKSYSQVVKPTTSSTDDKLAKTIKFMTKKAKQDQEQIKLLIDTVNELKTQVQGIIKSKDVERCSSPAYCPSSPPATD